MASGGVEKRRKRQLTTYVLLALLSPHGCSGADTPYIGAHRASFGRFLQALRDEMPMYDDRMQMVRGVCVSGDEGRQDFGHCLVERA